jgi:hypothetical protein
MDADPGVTQIEDLARRRGITRLCHLTPFRNLTHIARGEGLRSTHELLEDERAYFNQQDLDRLDGFPDHISCSIEYPNAWYLRQRRTRATPLQKLFPDWVCVLIEPHHLWRADSRVCSRNAAADKGAHVSSGPLAFEAMYADPVAGHNGWRIPRDEKPDSCPTDDQAEVLIAKQIPLADARRVAVPDETGAKKVLAGLDVLGVPIENFEIYVAPELFQVSLGDLLRAGQVPSEIPFRFGDEDAT